MGQALLRTTVALGIIAFVTGCAEVGPPPSTNVAPAPPLPTGYWNGDGVPGSPKIIVSIAEQRAYFFKGKNLVGETTVSTGKPGFGTPPGQYTVLSKDATHVSTVFGDYVDDFGNVVKSNIDSRKDPRPKGSHYDGARMPFAMFFRGGYAMHQGYVPPYAASHGCIRIPQGMAETFFNAATVGTPVIVKEGEVMHTVSAPPPAPVPTTVAPPPPTVVRSTSPAQVRPTTVRTTVPAPSPIPLRSPAAIVTRSPAPVLLRSPSPAPLRSPAPNQLRTTTAPPRVYSTTVPSPTPMAVRTPTPVLSRKPVPVQSPAPLQTSSPFPLRPSTPAPLRSPAPAPVRSPAPTSVQPAPTPAHSQTKKHSRHRKHHRSSAPAPTPTPTPAR